MPGGDLSLSSFPTAFWAHLFFLQGWFVLQGLQEEYIHPSSDTSLPFPPPAPGEHSWHKPFLEEVNQMHWINCGMGLVGNAEVCSAKATMCVLFPLGALTHKTE